MEKLNQEIIEQLEVLVENVQEAESGIGYEDYDSTLEEMNDNRNRLSIAHKELKAFIKKHDIAEQSYKYTNISNSFIN